jgi:DNA (cytosine-5)-methyltransferase 1
METEVEVSPRIDIVAEARPSSTSPPRTHRSASTPSHRAGAYSEGFATAVDICCGLGGLSEGLEMAGFNVRLALDASPSAVGTYQRNHPKTLVAIQDVTQFRKFQRYLSALGIRPHGLGLLAGGTPCQSFSAANSRKKPGRNEHHNLVLEFARLVQEAHPALFVLENVPRLKSAEGGTLLNEFLAQVERSGYAAEVQTLSAADYGVPQDRRRLFIVGSRIGPFKFMPPTHGPESPTGRPRVTVEDAIVGDLPPAIRKGRGEVAPSTDYIAPPKNWYQRWCRVGSRKVTDHFWNDLGTDVVRRFALIGPGRSWVQVQKEGGVPEDLTIRIDHRSVYRRLDLGKPSVTIVHFRKAMTIHPTENRLISFREAARLQSFRDRFSFSNQEGRIFQMDGVQQQLANAVPPLLARAVGRRLKARLQS